MSSSVFRTSNARPRTRRQGIGRRQRRAPILVASHRDAESAARRAERNSGQRDPCRWPGALSPERSESSKSDTLQCAAGQHPRARPENVDYVVSHPDRELALDHVETLVKFVVDVQRRLTARRRPEFDE
jgi:hypothetical protein